MHATTPMAPARAKIPAVGRRLLTMGAERGMLSPAWIRAQPLETPPQLESYARQRGAHSRIGIVNPLRHHGALLGRGHGVPKEPRRCHVTRTSNASFALA